jgi:PGF-pre-PGF domain-containing protein
VINLNLKEHKLNLMSILKQYVKQFVLAFVFITVILSFPIDVQAELLTTFSDGSSSKNLTFSSAGSQIVNITLPKNSIVSLANITISGWDISGNFTSGLTLDVGNTGNVYWRAKSYVPIQPNPNAELIGWSIGTSGNIDNITVSWWRRNFIESFMLRNLGIYLYDKNGYPSYLNLVYNLYICEVDSTKGSVPPTDCISTETLLKDNLTLNWTGWKLFQVNNFPIQSGKAYQFTLRYQSGIRPLVNNTTGTMSGQISGAGTGYSYGQYGWKMSSGYFTGLTVEAGIATYINYLFDTTEHISNFSSALNNYLNSCIADTNGNCNIPLKFSSQSMGGITLSNLNVVYNISRPPSQNVGPPLSSDSPWPMFHHDLQHTGRSPYFSLKSCKVKWTYQTPLSGDTSPVIAPDGTIYIGTSYSQGYGDNFFAINPNGTLKWSYNTGWDIRSTPAIASDGTIYVASSNNLYAINPNGTLKWRYKTFFDATDAFPAIAHDGTIYVGSWYGNLYALNPDGTLKWQYPPSLVSSGTGRTPIPAIATDGTIVFMMSANQVYALNPDGTLKWNYTIGTNPESIPASIPAIASDGTIYVGSGNNLYAINPNGTLKWSYNTEGTVVSSPAIASDGTVYIGSADYNLYAINPNGTLKWKYKTGYYIYSSPAITSDGIIYVVDHNGNFFAINPDGTLKWSCKIGRVSFSSPAISSDGTVYIVSYYDNNLYAIGAVPIQTFNLTILTNNPIAGTTSPSGSIIYTSVQNVTITATANKGYFFGNWTLDGSYYSSNSTIVVTTDANHTVVANFFPITNITINQTCSSGYTNCSGRCVNLSNDSSNCGSCGNMCLPSQTCVNGNCINRCPESCDDNNVCTIDYCNSTSGYSCAHYLIPNCTTVPQVIPTCKSQGGVICGVNVTCPDKWLKANDTDRCCSTICIPEVRTKETIQNATATINNITINVIIQNITVINVTNLIEIGELNIIQNITVTIPSIKAFEPVKINMSDVADTIISSITLNSNESVSDVKIHVHSSKNIFKNIPLPNVTKVYSYIEVDTENIEDTNITNVNISFKVSKRWLDENNVTNPSKIALQKYDESARNWRSLQTKLLSFDGQNYHYEAISPGLSFFAIAVTTETVTPIAIEKKPEGAFVVNFSWVFVVIVVVVIISVKYVYPKITRPKNEIREIENKLKEIEQMKKDAADKYFKRQITEESFKEIIKDLDEKKMELEVRLRNLKPHQ